MKFGRGAKLAFLLGFFSGLGSRMNSNIGVNPEGVDLLELRPPLLVAPPRAPPLPPRPPLPVLLAVAVLPPRAVLLAPAVFPPRAVLLAIAAVFPPRAVLLAPAVFPPLAGLVTLDAAGFLVVPFLGSGGAPG